MHTLYSLEWAVPFSRRSTAYLADSLMSPILQVLLYLEPSTQCSLGHGPGHSLALPSAADALDTPS